jgi:methylphosphotriester-DNA--protein-cysteine methyltransferase
MIAHPDLGLTAFTRSRKLKDLINAGKVRFGGNKRLKIYGTLACSSGKRMKVANRVFFESEREAIAAGYRPCGHCMPVEYLAWETGNASLGGFVR